MLVSPQVPDVGAAGNEPLVALGEVLGADDLGVVVRGPFVPSHVATLRELRLSTFRVAAREARRLECLDETRRAANIARTLDDVARRRRCAVGTVVCLRRRANPPAPSPSRATSPTWRSRSSCSATRRPCLDVSYNGHRPHRPLDQKVPRTTPSASPPSSPLGTTHRLTRSCRTSESLRPPSLKVPWAPRRGPSSRSARARESLRQPQGWRGW